MEQSITAISERPRLHGFALIRVISALLLTLFLEALDNNIVGPALPRIIEQFRAFDRYSWVVTAYLLASTVAIPIAGKLSDQFGRKWFLLGGASVFLLGSLLCGAAQNIDELIAFRALQGLGAGTGMALVATLIGDMFPPEKRARWQARVNIVYAVALIGPGLGGWLIDHGPVWSPMITLATRWRWIFYLNLIPGLLALVILLLYLPATISRRSSNLSGWEALRSIDLAGALFSASTTICLLLGLTWGSSQVYGWISPQVCGILLAALVLFCLLLFVERRATEPLLPLYLFRSRVFISDAALAVLVYMILLGLAIYLPLFLQEVSGISATVAGVAITPFLLSITAGAVLWGVLISLWKRYQVLIILGTALMLPGAFLLTRITPVVNLPEIVGATVLIGLGLGAIFSVIYLAAQNMLPDTQLGVGTALVRYLGQLGSILGPAILGIVINQSLADSGTKTKAALALALQRGFLVILLLCVLAVLAACFLKDAPVKSREA